MNDREMPRKDNYLPAPKKKFFRAKGCCDLVFFFFFFSSFFSSRTPRSRLSIHGGLRSVAVMDAALGGASLAK